MLKIGDKVRVRRRKDLFCEFVNPYGDLIIDVGHTFIKPMYNYCGKEVIIDDFADIFNDCQGYLLNIGYMFAFDLYMLETLDGMAL